MSCDFRRHYRYEYRIITLTYFTKIFCDINKTICYIKAVIALKFHASATYTLVRVNLKMPIF